MKRYIAIFNASISQEFAYRMNFIMWRFRNVIQIVMVLFLWDTVFNTSDKQLFGYTRESILTYIFLVMIVKAIVFSSKSMEVAGEISRGEITNYLLRPMSYFKYWMIRDVASKALNLSFSLVELILLFVLFKPVLFLQTNILYLLLSLLALIFACCLYYLLILFFSVGTFWIPEQAWGFIFLLMVFSDLLGGTLYPIDVLPVFIQNILYLTPFPYLIFIPIQIYLGKLTLILSIKALGIAFFWIIALFALVKHTWYRGLITYEGAGR